MTDEERFCNKRCCSNPCRHRCEYASVYLNGLAEGRKESGKDIEVLTKENEQLKISNNALTIQYEQDIAELKAQIEEMKNFVKSMYEANKNDAYCREYLGTILNEWELEK